MTPATTRQLQDPRIKRAAAVALCSAGIASVTTFMTTGYLATAAGIPLALITTAYGAMSAAHLTRALHAPVRVVMRNGLGLDMTTVELTPGREVTLEFQTIHNLCDRGFGSKGGKHRLITKAMPFRMSVSLEHPLNPSVGTMPREPSAAAEQTTNRASCLA